MLILFHVLVLGPKHTSTVCDILTSSVRRMHYQPRKCLTTPQKSVTTGKLRYHFEIHLLEILCTSLMALLRKLRFRWAMCLSKMECWNSFISQMATSMPEFSRKWQLFWRNGGIETCPKFMLNAKVSSAYLLLSIVAAAEFSTMNLTLSIFVNVKTILESICKAHSFKLLFLR